MSHKRSQEDKRRLKKKYETVGRYRYLGGVWYNEESDRYIRYWRSGHRSKFCKYCQRQSNRKVRRTKDIDNYSNYRKLFDYWWFIT